MESIRSQIDFELAQQALITKGITVTDKDVDDYIEANKETQFTEPAEVGYISIAANTVDLQKQVDAELAKGRRFKDIADQFSMSNAKGQTQNVALRALPQPVQDALNKAGVNGTTAWFPAENNSFVKFYVVSTKKEKPIEITASRKEQVRRELARQRGSQGKDINKRILEELVAAKVEIKKSSLKRMWEAFKQNAENALKQANAADTLLPSTTDGATTPSTGTETDATTGN